MIRNATAADAAALSAIYNRYVIDTTVTFEEKAVTGLTHRQAYKDIFAITVIKTLAVMVIIGVFYATGIV